MMVQSTYLSTTTVIITLMVALQPPTAASLSVTASFRQKGVTGTVTFSQTSPISPTSIAVSLSGLPQGQYPWHIHLYPYRTGTEYPCSSTSVGGHYDPFGASLSSTYTSDCHMNKSLCEVGDISGKFGNLNGSTQSLTLIDDSITLYGLYSIIGRSVVLHTNGSRYICANIDYPGESEDTFVASYVPLRGGSIVGDVTIIQYMTNATMVYSRLSNAISMSLNHNWHVHDAPVAFDDANCASALGHYNPRGVSTSGNYSLLCNGLTPTSCEVGDLSGKGGTLDFMSNLGRSLYTDTDLPYTLMQDISIANRSIVLHEAQRGPQRIACGNIRTIAREAIAVFNGQNSITGEIKFKQASPFSNTEVEISLNGLNGQVEDYYIYETPIGEGDNGCSAQYTGDIWTPDNSYSSGQLGSLNGNEQHTGTFTGVNIPLYGSNSIVGRSVVLHNVNGSRWACADIVYTGPIIEATALVNISGQMIVFSFMQPANDPFADTTITVKTVTNMQQNNETSTSTITPATSTTASQSTVPSPSTSSISYSSNSMTDSTLSMSMTTGNSLSSSSFTMSLSKTTVSSSVMSTAIPFSSSVVPMPFVTSSVMPSLESPIASNVQSAYVSNSPSIHVDSSPIMDGSGGLMMERRRKRESLEEDVYELDDDSLIDDEELLELQHYIHKREVVMVNWSVKETTGQQGMSSCDSLEDFLPTSGNSAILCSSGELLACSAGGLADKHGLIPLNTEEGIRMVLTDPYLPLSGPDSAIGNALLVSSEGTSQYVIISDSNTQQEPIVCDQQPTTTTTSTPTTVSTSVIGPTPSSESDLPLPLPYLITICVGGVLVLAILLVLLIVIIVCCARRRNKYSFETYAKSKTSGVELGMYKRSNPIYGVASYKVLYNYKPQAEGDLELFEGEMVTLIEAPAGGDWWRGKVRDAEGWFPKTYVNYVDAGAEQKKKKEAEIDRVEAVIKAYTIAGSSRMSTIHVDSTPKMVTKFNKPLKEENESKTVEQSYPLPYTPPESGHASPSLSEHKTDLANTLTTTEATLQSPPPSNESLPIVNESSLPSTQSPSPVPESPIPIEDIYIAKFDLVPEIDTELQLNAGDRVAIIERADNGWWHGVIGDRHGWLPETFVRPLEEVDDTLRSGSDEKQDEEEEESKFRPRGMTEFHSGTSEEVNVSEYQAITEYNSDTPGDLSFQEGEKVLVYWGNDNGWWFGAVGSVQGWFPGSYVEPIMEEGTPSPSTIHNTLKTAEEKDESNAEPLDFGNSIAAALKRREQKATEQEVSTPSVSDSGNLASEIGAALSKTDQQTTESSTTDSEDTLADQIAVALKQKLGKDDSPLHKEERERSDSIDKLGNDIASMIFSLGSNEELSNVEKTGNMPSPKASTARRPQRKAPLPPNSASRSKSTKVKSKGADTKLPQASVVTPPGSIPVPPPPPPLPVSPPVTATVEKPLTDNNQANNLSVKPVIEIASSENHSRPNSPASSKRRKPPSPPSHLAAAQHGSESPRSPSPLVTHSRKSPTPTSKNAPEELTLSSSPVNKDDFSRLSNKSPSPFLTNEQKTQAQVQRSASSSSKWQPQLKHKSSGWKPQTKKNKQESAPRREPPKPPPSKAGESPLKIRVQKVKRPHKNIPPPPSAPLPPPPPSKSKSSASLQEPPPVKKVLAGPPPVKKVLGAGSQDPNKRLSKSLSPPPAAVIESSIVEDPGKRLSKSLSPPPVVMDLSIVDETSKTVPDKPSTPTETNVHNKVTPVVNLELENNSNSSNSQNPHVPSKPAVSPKPKMKPAVSPKPKSLHPHQIGEIENGLKTDSNDNKLPTPKPRPIPPTRTSSLPNTPENSPCPSPVVPKTKIVHEEPPSNSKISAVPKRPPPPGANKNVGDATSVNKPSVSEATDSGVLDKEAESESSVPVPQTRKKSSTLPPRPAPPRTVKTQVNSEDVSSSTTANAPNPKPRKVSEVGVKIKGLMNPMKTLEARPSRRDKLSESEDTKPVPKRRTSQDTSEMKSSNIPVRPPPPAVARSKPNPDN